MVPWVHPSPRPNGISNGSATLAQLIVISNTQTDIQRPWNIGNINSVHAMQPNNNNPFNGPISKLAGCRKKHLSTSVKWPNTQLHLWQPTPEMSSILQACGMTCNQSTSTDNSRKTGCWLHWPIVRYWPTPLSGSQFWHASSAVASAQPFLLHKERVVHVDACGKTRSISHLVTSYPNTETDGGLSCLHWADDNAINCLMSLGTQHTMTILQENCKL